MNDLTLAPLHEYDLDEIVLAFKEIGWHKPRDIYEKYLKEQLSDVRSIFIAKCNGKFCGYVTLKWQSDYSSFLEKNIPEISDLNVLPDYRKHGIGKILIQSCEKLAREKGKVMIGLGVGLIEDYGDAQRLYYKLGYIPDGKGLHYKNQIIKYGMNVIADDDLNIFLIKQLNNT